MKKIAVLSFAALAFSGLASASITPSLDSGFPTFISAAVGFQYRYTIAVDALEQLNPVATAGKPCTPAAPCGTFFTIYDIAGLLGTNGGGAPPQPQVPTVPAGWSYSIQLLGATANPQTTVPDSASIANVSYIYNGATQVGPFSLGGFSYYSSIGTTTQNGFFSYQASRQDALGNVQANTPDTGQGGVTVPLAGVPEPGSMLLIGGGLVGLALLRRKLVR